MVYQTKDEARLIHLIRIYETELLRVSFYFLKDKMLSEDAIQDTFLKVYKNISLCPDGPAEKAWIYKIALNTIRDAQRRMRVRKRFVFFENASFSDSTPLSGDIIALHAAIMRLPRKMKEVILLYYYQDFSVMEIAGILNLSQSSVSGRLKRARERISKELKGETGK